MDDRQEIINENAEHAGDVLQAGRGLIMADEKLRTPLHIVIAIHYATNESSDFGRPPTGSHERWHAIGAQNSIREMVEAGLLESTRLENEQRFYRATPGLKMYVDALCAVPWPVQKWGDA